jgi:hypothetical protein
MSKILLITPPDKIHNLDPAFLLICPTDEAKAEFQATLAQSNEGIRIYWYRESDQDIDWLLDVFQAATAVYIDLDNSPPEVREIAAFFIAHSKTYWLTNGAVLSYSNLSVNRVYDMSWALSQVKGESIPNEE